MKNGGLFLLLIGLAMIALGASQIAWGNWCPILPSYNSPTVFGVMEVGLGVALATGAIVFLVDDWNDRL